MTRCQLEGPAIPRTVRDETSERGGVSPPVLGRKPSSEEPGGLELAPVLVRISKLARRASFEVALIWHFAPTGQP